MVAYYNNTNVIRYTRENKAFILKKYPLEMVSLNPFLSLPCNVLKLPGSRTLHVFRHSVYMIGHKFILKFYHRKIRSHILRFPPLASLPYEKNTIKSIHKWLQIHFSMHKFFMRIFITL